MVPPNHPFLIGFSIIHHPFWDSPIFGNTQIERNNVDSQQSCTYTLGFLLMFPKYLEKEMLMFQQKSLSTSERD